MTADRPSREGYIWSRVPLTASNWEVLHPLAFPSSLRRSPNR